MLLNKQAQAKFLLINMGETGESGLYIEETRQGKIIYADEKKCTILTNKGVPMSFCLEDVTIM